MILNYFNEWNKILVFRIYSASVEFEFQLYSDPHSGTSTAIVYVRDKLTRVYCCCILWLHSERKSAHCHGKEVKCGFEEKDGEFNIGFNN